VSRHFSRRAALAAGGGLALAAAGTGGGIALSRTGDDSAAAPGPPDVSRTPAGRPVATPTPLPARTGGRAHLFAARSFTFDTFDAARSGDVSTLEVLGRTHSRLFQWADPVAGMLAPDLVEAVEQPDMQTLLLQLRRNARWHDRRPLDGRALTADDVVASLSRAIEIGASTRLPVAQRQQDLGAIRSVATEESGLVRVESAAPDPFLMHTLAGRFTLIQAPEAVQAFESSWPGLSPETVAGSGPFVYDGFDDQGFLALRANLDGHTRPLVDALRIAQPVDAVPRFRAREVDEAITRDRRDAAALADDPGPDAYRESLRFESEPVISTMFVGAPPWSDPKLGLAVRAALNRGELGRRLFGGRAAASSPLPPVSESFALPESELATFPGYRADHAEDAAQARALWEAAGGPALGTVTIDFPAVFDPLYSASSVVTGMLAEALGTDQFRAAVENYTTISRKTAEGAYGNGNAAFWFGWGPPFAEPEPSRSLDETYRSGSPSATALGFSSTEVDALLTRLIVEFDPDARRETAREVARTLLGPAGSPIADWLVQTSEVFRRRYLTAPPASPWWAQHLDADIALDLSDEDYPRRS
jgi:peptide/nickel transport system substrate-binding protein